MVFHNYIVTVAYADKLDIENESKAQSKASPFKSGINFDM